MISPGTKQAFLKRLIKDVNLFRLEKIKFTNIRSQAKLAGTVITVGGAMLMTLVRGPIIEVLWNKGRSNHEIKSSGGVDLQNSIKGSLMITIGCFSWACFMVPQVRNHTKLFKLIELLSDKACVLENPIPSSGISS